MINYIIGIELIEKLSNIYVDIYTKYKDLSKNDILPFGKSDELYDDPKKDNFFAYNKIRLFKPNLFEFESAINFKEQDKSFEDLGKVQF